MALFGDNEMLTVIHSSCQIGRPLLATPVMLYMICSYPTQNTHNRTGGGKAVFVNHNNAVTTKDCVALCTCVAELFPSRVYARRVTLSPKRRSGLKRSVISDEDSSRVHPLNTGPVSAVLFQYLHTLQRPTTGLASLTLLQRTKAHRWGLLTMLLQTSPAAQLLFA
jgi:hypothetical protein